MTREWLFVGTVLINSSIFLKQQPLIQLSLPCIDVCYHSSDPRREMGWATATALKFVIEIKVKQILYLFINSIYYSYSAKLILYL